MERIDADRSRESETEGVRARKIQTERERESLLLILKPILSFKDAENVIKRAMYLNWHNITSSDIIIRVLSCIY